MVKGTVVDICAELHERRREIVAIIDDRDHHRGRTIAIAQVEVRTGETPAAESSISFTNNLAQAVNVYVTPATGGGERRAAR